MDDERTKQVNWIFILAVALGGALGSVMRYLVGIGGGYTTFSTFSLDSFYLIERGEFAATTAYMAGSALLSVSALIGAMHLVRTMA